MTNSGQYAHYAPAWPAARVHFGNLAACVEAACTGTTKDNSQRLGHHPQGNR